VHVVAPDEAVAVLGLELAVDLRAARRVGSGARRSNARRRRLGSIGSARARARPRARRAARARAVSRAPRRAYSSVCSMAMFM